MKQAGISRRLLLGEMTTTIAAPALIGRAKAATTLKISTSFPNDPKFSTARIWYDLFLPRLEGSRRAGHYAVLPEISSVRKPTWPTR